MIKWKLFQVMAAHRIKNKDLAVELGRTESTISNMKRSPSMPRINGKSLNQLIEALSRLSEQQIEISDLLEKK